MRIKSPSLQLTGRQPCSLHNKPCEPLDTDPRIRKQAAKSPAKSPLSFLVFRNPDVTPCVGVDYMVAPSPPFSPTFHESNIFSCYLVLFNYSCSHVHPYHIPLLALIPGPLPSFTSHHEPSACSWPLSIAVLSSSDFACDFMLQNFY